MELFSDRLRLRQAKEIETTGTADWVFVVFLTMQLDNDCR